MTIQPPTDPNATPDQSWLDLVGFILERDRGSTPANFADLLFTAVVEPAGFAGLCLSTPAGQATAGKRGENVHKLSVTSRLDRTYSIELLGEQTASASRLTSGLQSILDILYLRNLAASQGTGSSDQQIARYRSRLQKLASELSLAEARERRTIAENLHDHVGQALAFVRTRLSRLQGNSVFHGFENDFSDSVRLLDQTISYIRDLTVTISPPVLYELGLGPAIEWLGDQAKTRYNLRAKVSLKADLASLPEDIQVILFKSIQELLVNTTKHATATRIEISASSTTEEIRIEVRDNGRGFDPSILEKRMARNEGFGLFSIRERIKSVGGKLEIASSVGNGTAICLDIPRNLGDQTNDL